VKRVHLVEQGCFDQWQHHITHPIMLVPLQEEQTMATIEDDASSDSSASNIIDILDCHTDEEESSEQQKIICCSSQHSYSIVDPIPVDLSSYCYVCNGILDKKGKQATRASCLGI